MKDAISYLKHYAFIFLTISISIDTFGQEVRYNQAVHIMNHYSRGWLDSCNPVDYLKCSGTRIKVSTNRFKDRAGAGTGTWFIVSTTGKDGPVEFGDAVHIRNKWGNYYLDSCGEADCSETTRTKVSTNTFPDRAGEGTGIWFIESVIGKKGKIEIGDAFYIRNKWGNYYLDTCNPADCSPSTLYEVSTNTLPDRTGEGTGTWTFSYVDQKGRNTFELTPGRTASLVKVRVGSAPNAVDVFYPRFGKTDWGIANNSWGHYYGQQDYREIQRSEDEIWLYHHKNGDFLKFDLKKKEAKLYNADLSFKEDYGTIIEVRKVTGWNLVRATYTDLGKTINLSMDLSTPRAEWYEYVWENANSKNIIRRYKEISRKEGEVYLESIPENFFLRIDLDENKIFWRKAYQPGEYHELAKIDRNQFQLSDGLQPCLPRGTGQKPHICFE